MFLDAGTNRAVRSRSAPYRLVPLVLLATVLAGSATTQEDVSQDPGFVDFALQDVLSDDELEVHVSVKDPMIKLVAEGTREADPEFAAVLDPLKGVEVHVYSVPEDRRSAVRKEISDQAKKLEGQGWTEAIAIRLKGARGHVFLRLVDGRPVGLVAMYSDDEGEAVFVNIVGAIDPSKVGRLATKFDLDVLSTALDGPGGGGF